MGFQFQSIASASPFLVDKLGISYTQIGTLIGLFMLPGIVIALPGGMPGKFFGDKRVCASGLALMALGGVVAGLSESYTWVFVGRLTSGVGAVLFNVVITKMVTDWFAGKEIITAMGMFLATWPLGIALALVTQSAVAEAYSWQAIMYLTTLACSIGLGLVVIFYRNPVSAGENAAGMPFSIKIPRREFVPVCAAGLAWGIFNVGFATFFSFTPALLTSQGRSPVDAGALVSLGLWVSLFSVPLGGYLTEKIGWPNAMIVIFALVAGLALFLIPYLPNPALFSILVGIGVGPSAGAIVALPSLALSPENRGPGFGVFYSWYYGAMALGPAIAGLSRDLTGSPAAPVLFGGAMFAASTLFVATFRLLMSRRTARTAAA